MNKECVLINIAVSGDIRTQIKEDEKLEKHQDLARGISKLWGVQTTVILIINKVLGMITDYLTSFLAMVGMSLSFETIQKSTLV